MQSPWQPVPRAPRAELRLISCDNQLGKSHKNNVNKVPRFFDNATIAIPSAFASSFSISIANTLAGHSDALNGIVSAHFGFSFYCSACEFKWANGKLSTGREHNRARRPEKRATSAITSSLTTFPFWLQLSLNAFSALAQFVASAGERYSTSTQAKPAYLLRAARGGIGNLKLLRPGSIEVNWMNTFIFWQCKSRDSKFKPQLQIQFENSSLGTFESTLRGIPIKYLCYDFPLNS